MKRVLLGLASLVIATGALASQAVATTTPAAAGGLWGVWRNPHNSVHIAIRPCGGSACGDVVWASDKAQEDARKGSGKDLVGQQLLRDFNPKGTSWRGKVYVPDLNITLSGSAKLLDESHIDAQGCLLGVICKHQVWTRVEEQATR
jgi:uncharacterized protein (DUF2147 family)